MRVAFLGLGIMGQAMATNLAKAGHEVTVWNRTPGKLVEGAGIAPTPAAAAQGAEVVWLCVSDTAAVEQILFGSDGIDQSLTDGMIIADSSTISPSATVKFADRVRAKGVAYVDAPMTGSKIGAANGSLIFMVGGDAAIIDRLNPLFAAMGKKIFRMGDTGKGQATKLAMNLQIALIFEGFAEALTLATKLGVDPKQLLSLIDATMVRSGVVDYKGPFILQRDFTPNFPLRLHAQGHSPHPRGRQRSARKAARSRNRRRDLRNGYRRWPPRSRLCRDLNSVGKMGGNTSKKRSRIDRVGNSEGPSLCGDSRPRLSIGRSPIILMSQQYPQIPQIIPRRPSFNGIPKRAEERISIKLLQRRASIKSFRMRALHSTSIHHRARRRTVSIHSIRPSAEHGYILSRNPRGRTPAQTADCVPRLRRS